MHNFLEIISTPDNVAIVVMLVLVAASIVAAFAMALGNDRRLARHASDDEAGRLAREDNEAKVHVWPYLARKEFLVTVIVIVALIIWSVVLDAPLEGQASATLTPNPAKAPWYFVGLQEMLVYFDPWIAGVVLPGLIIVGLMAIPYLDPNPAGSGYYTLAQRRWTITVFCFGFFLWIALIVIGTFFRGSGWMWFWPWEVWDSQKVIRETNVDLTEFIGIPSRSVLGGVLGGAIVTGYFAAGTALPYALWRRKDPAGLRALGPTRYLIVMGLLLTMIGLVIKMALRLTITLKYVWVTPWFNV